MSTYTHPDRIAAAEMTAAANERAGLSSRQRRHAAAFRKGAESATDDLRTLITAIAGTDNYDHTLSVSYFVEMLAAERRRKDELVYFVARWAWRTDPPHANNRLTDSERLSVIKFHPTIKAAAQPHIELAEREARQPEPRT